MGQNTQWGIPLPTLHTIHSKAINVSNNENSLCDQWPRALGQSIGVGVLSHTKFALSSSSAAPWLIFESRLVHLVIHTCSVSFHLLDQWSPGVPEAVKSHWQIFWFHGVTQPSFVRSSFNASSHLGFVTLIRFDLVPKIYLQHCHNNSPSVASLPSIDGIWSIYTCHILKILPYVLWLTSINPPHGQFDHWVVPCKLHSMHVMYPRGSIIWSSVSWDNGLHHSLFVLLIPWPFPYPRENVWDTKNLLSPFHLLIPWSHLNW